jgi:hypothetical protein
VYGYDAADEIPDGVGRSSNTLDDDSSAKSTMITVSVIVSVVALLAIGAATYFFAKYRLLLKTLATHKTTQPMKSIAVADVALTEAE